MEAMMTLDEAREMLRAAARTLPPRTCRLSEAHGLVLAAPARADVDMPTADLSAMDGYAFAWTDDVLEKALPVSIECAAGVPPLKLPEGSAARIFTGAAVPIGADTVVPQEDAQPDGRGGVRFNAASAGRHIRRRAEVFAEGDPLLEAGERINADRAALLAGAGAVDLEIYPRPRIAVMLTGSELVAPEQKPQPGQTRNTNGSLFAALACEAGVEVTGLRQVGDDEDDLRKTLVESLESSDLVVSSGGVSVGDYDLLPQVISAIGGEILFHKIRVKPGKPTLFARVGEKWLASLPGNPLACTMGWRMFVRPLIEALAGDDRAFFEDPMSAEISEECRNRGDRRVLQPATVSHESSGARIAAIRWKGSHDLLSISRADALLDLAPGACHASGDRAPYFPLDWARRRLLRPERARLASKESAR